MISLETSPNATSEFKDNERYKITQKLKKRTVTNNITGEITEGYWTIVNITNENAGSRSIKEQIKSVTNRIVNTEYHKRWPRYKFRTTYSINDVTV